MKRYSLDLVVVVTLFCVYAACALMLCVIGAQVYRGTADTMRMNYDSRTSVLYVAEKVRHNDLADSVRTDSVGGNDALVLTERRSGRGYETWLFVQDGMLYEGVFAPGATVDIKLCQPILPLEEMTVSMTQGRSPVSSVGPGPGDPSDPGSGGSLLIISFTTIDGRTESIDLWLRSTRMGR
ncbi:MAG: DUF4860 domain-containing protein [Coriobacteriia bacterium]|nr:DUF4860 domain-containing protein [Coriobacteriia bacterium]